jgi:molybdate transport system permease protein
MTLTPDEFDAIRLTCMVALVAVACSLPAGVAVAWTLARREFYGKTLLETVVNLPLVLPPVVTGYLLLILFGRQGIVGKWLDSALGIQLIFDWKGAVVASGVMAFPLLVRPMRLSFAGIDRRLELAARTLGARPLDVFCTISLPLAARGIVAGSVLAFARAMGEFGATIMIAGNIPGQTRTVPLYIYGLLETPGGIDRAPILVTWCIGIAAAALLVGEYLERRGRRLQQGG